MKCTAPIVLVRLAPTLLLAAAASLMGCEDAPAPKPPTRVATPSAPTPPTVAPAATAAASAATSTPALASAPSDWHVSTSADDPSILEVAGFRAPKPASWVWTKPTMQFRTLQYSVAGAGDSTLAGELIVSVFLAGDGGPIDANISRWQNQFRVDGAPPTPILSNTEVGPLKIQFVELAGEYMAMGSPAPKQDFVQLAAIVQAEGRNVFFRIIGPKATVEANRADFMKMIEGIMPAD